MAVVRQQRLLKPGKDWRANPEAFKAYHISVAREELRQAQNEGVFPTDKDAYVTKVNRSITGHNREREVKLDNRIQYLRFGVETDWVPAALEVVRLIMRQVPWSMKRMWDLKSGTFRARHYKNSFALLRNKRMVVGPGSRFKERAQRYISKYAASMNPGDMFQVTNIQPYARRMDYGAPSHNPWSRQAPKGVFRRAFAEAKRSKKTRALELYLDFQPLPGEVSDQEVAGQGATVKYAERRRTRGKWSYSGRVMKKHRVYPVLTFGPPRDGKTLRTDAGAKWTHRAGTYEVVGGGTGTVFTQVSSISSRAMTVVREV